MPISIPGLAFGGHSSDSPGGLVLSTQIQSGISGGPPGNNSTETDITFQDQVGNGARWGFLPAYGGRGGVPWYEMVAGVQSIPQVSLATTKADSNFHIYSHVGSTYTASEDATYTLSELSGLERAVRAYYDSGTSAQDANGFTWRVRTAIWPGDPMPVFLRLDMSNSASVTTATTDSYEVTFLSGLIQSTQNGVNAWGLADGGYGIVGGSSTSGLPSPGTGVAEEPDYMYIIPHSGSNRNLGLVSVKAQAYASFVAGVSNVQIFTQQDSVRLKAYLQCDKSTATAAGTHTWNQLIALRLGLTATDAASIAADYLNPDTGTSFSNLSGGTFSSFSYDEGCYQFASTTGNSLAFQHSISGSVTARWNPAYKITGWTSNVITSLVLGGAVLAPGTDYFYHVDTVNQIAYVKLTRQIVASGASGRQINNGLITVAG